MVLPCGHSPWWLQPQGEKIAIGLSEAPKEGGKVQKTSPKEIFVAQEVLVQEKIVVSRTR